MGKKKKQKNIEIRADTVTTDQMEISGDTLLRALLGLDDDATSMTREKAMQLPTVQACLNIISDTISRLPIQLLKRKRNGDIEIVKNDPRVTLLNDDTGDTLTAKMFWRAMIEDYYMGKGGFAYIRRQFNKVLSIHYVRDEDICIYQENFDPILKDYKITVQGRIIPVKDFIKILRKTRDGMRSRSIIEDNPLVLSVAYAELKYELANAKKGGAKRGFLEAEKQLTQPAMDALKEGFRRLYGESDENVVILNSGVKFHESSATAAELQMNENKESNAQEICKLFGIPASMISGSQTGNSMTENDMNQFIRACVAVMTDIECSLNRDLLLETEKKSLYWQFDTKELTRGSIKERYEAYKIGLEKNFLQIDEVREKEDMEPLGVDWIQLGLNTVLYNPKTNNVYTPNTNMSANLEKPQTQLEQTGNGEPEPQQEPTPPETDEGRAYDGKNLIITGAPGSGKTTLAKGQMTDGDTIVDLDAIKCALLGNDDFHGNASDIVPMITIVRDSIYKAIQAKSAPGKCFILTTETDKTVLAEWQRMLNADLMVMDTPKQTCIDRINADDTRPNKQVFLNLIEKWFREWEGGEGNES